MPPHSTSKYCHPVILGLDNLTNILALVKAFVNRDKGKTIARPTVGMYDAVLDEAPGMGCIKYEGPATSSAPLVKAPVEVASVPKPAEGLLSEEEEEHEVVNTTGTDGWRRSEVFIDSRLSGGESFNREVTTISLKGALNVTPLDYFLFFLPLHHFSSIIGNINIHAARSATSWRKLTLNKYLMWIALLTVMTVIRHSDRKAYWRQGRRHFHFVINFSEYMSYQRFIDIMRMHTFEVPGLSRKLANSLYQICPTITSFNDHMVNCLVPGKCSVIDESMNPWLGVVPRKPHPIGQEFKTLTDHHTHCILRIDTVSDPRPKEYDDEPGMRKLTAAIKRLVKTLVRFWSHSDR
ncbi:hypothetical protein A0J61_09529 [Choanephora cucurbitarum]|uniref:PiggyBac transposable element-derived protein domain-containing protein n=1 Tax=Choanephora cucurbitarum TaxID=101091 RepID=A0A1C7N071_9FUNG|nr:hypothetical protein A0J61_09529 [Choanephora cucurbitarum]